MSEDGTLDSESKKQASRLKREMRKIKSNLHGIRKMSRLPGAVVVVDAKKEYLALREAKKLGITTVGLLDTDSDPDTVDVAIPANDDSIRAIELILGELADAVAIGKTMITAHQEPTQRPKRIRSRKPAMARADKDKTRSNALTMKTTGSKRTGEVFNTTVVEQASAQTVEPAAQEGQLEQQEPK